MNGYLETMMKTRHIRFLVLALLGSAVLMFLLTRKKATESKSIRKVKICFFEEQYECILYNFSILRSKVLLISLIYVSFTEYGMDSCVISWTKIQNT